VYVPAASFPLLPSFFVKSIAVGRQGASFFESRFFSPVGASIFTHDGFLPAARPYCFF